MAKLLKLFTELFIGDWFHFGNEETRKLVKSDHSHYIGPVGRRSINPLTLVVKEESKASKSIFDQTKGDQDVDPELNG